VTSGSFYSHFGSKTELLKALIGNELQISRDMWAGNPHNTAEEWVNFELDRYLSMGHVNHPESGCIIPALGAEIARADNSVKALYAQELHKGIVILATRLGSEAQALAFICQMVGAIVMARAMPSAKEKKTILESSKQFLQHTLQSQHKTVPQALLR
jgi:AcrR family transcriptional regulator